MKYRPFKPYKEGFEEMMEKNKQAFWDEQAGKGVISGTQDRYAKELEMAAIARYVKDGMRVLDVGCGDGETLHFLADKVKIKGLGIDFSRKMVGEAKRKKLYGKELSFFRWDIKDFATPLKIFEPFDLIYTQRSLINLDTWEEQRQAILDILSLLKPGGTYVMVECFQEGLQEINELRLKVGLESIVPPWHNRYLKIVEMVKLCKELIMQEPGYKWPDIEYFSSAYYLMSRVVNAWLAQQLGMQPQYDATLNYLGTLLPPECVNLRGQSQLWCIKKKEGK